MLVLQSQISNMLRIYHRNWNSDNMLYTKLGSFFQIGIMSQN